MTQGKEVVMDSFEQATQQGLRRGWRNFLASLGTHLGKVFAYALLAVVVVLVAIYALDYVWDGFTSPFRGAGSWMSEKWDWATGWWPGGDEAVVVSTDVVTEPVTPVAETVPAATSTEPAAPGAICSRTGSWNPFCD